MLAFAAALLGVFVVAPLATAADPPGDPDFVVRCRDGRLSDGAVSCDTDGRADGVCTFGGGDGMNLRVAVDNASRMANSCDAVGEFVCESASAPMSPGILYPPGSPQAKVPGLVYETSPDDYRVTVARPRTREEKRAALERKQSARMKRYAEEHGLIHRSGKGTKGFIRDIREFAESSRKAMGPPKPSQ